MGFFNAPMNQSLDTKYKQKRMTLLLIVIFSVVNLFALTFGDTYFVFSSYFTMIIPIFGLEFYVATGDSMYLIVTFVLGIISVVPYLLAWIFSKKTPIWMIIGTALFGIDTIFLLLDIPVFLAAGDFTMIIDLAFHVFILIYLGIGIKQGFDLKREKEAEAQATCSTPDIT